jgi:Fic family protein
MAIIVDKECKRNNIACAGKELLLEHGIRNITISQIAQTANIGKGTVYECFENKEDIPEEVEYWVGKYAKVKNICNIAHAHEHFELMHPFGDGNGRIGRLILAYHFMTLGVLPR